MKFEIERDLYILESIKKWKDTLNNYTFDLILELSKIRAVE